MHIRYVVQARLTSKRLERKVLRPLGGRPLIAHIIERLERVDAPDTSLVFAIPPESSGAEECDLAQYLRDVGVEYCVGDEHDVLARFIDAARGLKDEDYIIRLTGDNPFIDYKELAQIADYLRAPAPKDHRPLADLIYPYKLPLGMGFEGISVRALREQKLHDLSPHHEEHVSTFIKENPSCYAIEKIDRFEGPDIRLTVDVQADLDTAEGVYGHFSSQGNPWFCTAEVYRLAAENPGLFSLNTHVQQRSPRSYETRTR